MIFAANSKSYASFSRYNFLNKAVQITSSFEIRKRSYVDESSNIIMIYLPMRIPGFEGLIIPGGTRGRVLRMLHGNTAVVRWEVNIINVVFSSPHIVVTL